MKLFAICAMQLHEGSIKKCDCIGRFFLCTLIARQSDNHAVQKNADDHGDNRITKPSSKQLTEHCCSINPDNATPLATIMARYLDPQITQKPLPLKKHPFSPEFVECMNLRILTHGQEMHGHFWPCRLRSLTPLILTECKRQGVYFSVKTMWVLAISPIFIQKITQNTHHFISSFPMQLKTCNN